MSTYRTQLSALHEGVVGRSDEVLPLIKHTREAFPSEARLHAYSGGYFSRLAEVTLADYPATAHLMGEEEAARFADAYSRLTPSTYWDLNHYSFAFADFIAAQRPQDTGLIALAKLESAIAQCFWAEDSAPLMPEALQLSDEEFAGHHFTLRTASRLVVLPAQAEPYLAAFRADTPLAQVAEGGQYMLIIRHDRQVRRHVLEAPEYGLLSAIDAGKPFGKALESVEDQDALAEHLGDYLSRALTQGYFSS